MSFSIVLINGLSTTATVIVVAGPPAAGVLCVADAAPPEALDPVAAGAGAVVEADADAFGFEDPHADRTTAPTNATASTGTVGAR